MILYQGPSTPNPADPNWLQLLERLGLPIFLILFACLVAWKLLPHVIDWFKQQTTSAKVVADAVPDMKASLAKMADGTGDKLDSIERRTQEILARLPPKN